MSPILKLLFYFICKPYFQKLAIPWNAMPRPLPEPLPEIVVHGNGDALRAIAHVRFGVPRTGGERRACVRMVHVSSLGSEAVRTASDRGA